MKIETLTLKNYRAFVDPVEIRLRPLTLFFGYNSVGKSALLRALPLIADSLDSKEAAPLALGSPATRGATFGDLLPHSSLSATPEISLGLKLAVSEKNQTKTLSLQWIIRDLPDHRQQIVERFELGILGELKVSVEWSPGVKESGSGTGSKVGTRYRLIVGDFPPRETELPFRGLLPIFDIKSKPPEDPLVRAASLLAALVDEGPKVQWLSSVRRTPERLLRWPGSAPALLGPDGTSAAEILAFDSANGSILTDVSGWYEEHFGLRLKVKPLENLFRLLVEPMANSPAELYLQDAGDASRQDLQNVSSLYEGMPQAVRESLHHGFGPQVSDLLEWHDRPTWDSWLELGEDRAESNAMIDHLFACL